MKSLQLHCLPEAHEVGCWCGGTKLADVKWIIFKLKSKFEHLAIIGLRDRQKSNAFDSFYMHYAYRECRDELSVKVLSGSIELSGLDPQLTSFQAVILSLVAALPSLEGVHLIAIHSVEALEPCGKWTRHAKSGANNELLCCDPKLSVILKGLARRVFRKIFQTLSSVGRAIMLKG